MSWSLELYLSCLLQTGLIFISSYLYLYLKNNLEALYVENLRINDYVHLGNLHFFLAQITLVISFIGNFLNQKQLYNMCVCENISFYFVIENTFHRRRACALVICLKSFLKTSWVKGEFQLGD